MRLLTTTLALSLTATAPAQTKSPEPKCVATTPALPPEFAGWLDRTPLTAATTAPAATRATLTVGKAAQLRLSPTPAVRFALRPERPAAPDTHAGLVAFTIARPGTYRVALGAGMWIDLVRDGRAVPSTTHRHGPPCGGIRKTVDFRLTPGRHLIQLSGGKESSVTAMIAAIG
ncbi:homogentisate 1,2-dioxygenase [uncultured Sphingomonas sp.]|uniref:homogentisate 1,2-dioxygenase n=1 Tax=uncultured Sphingomonas sp. TaxID=158754 RepID=UPI0035CC1D86